MFDKMPERNVYSWNAVISAIVKLEVHFLNVRLSTGRPNKWVITLCFQGFAKTDGCESEALEMFGENHCSAYPMWFTVKTVNDATRFAVSSLIHMFSKCGSC
ncbi:hypothetical protein Bca4012_090334 [Brassica carinata]|uniref:Pentatricopeptide repeat-containing protein n=2 Tax=Brassica TaxID=3705 RepID=A0A3P6G6M9_BRAOL|nr:unnamed protein product [Brassica napus]VDD52102.1 unnamed protein product [Brassica oleracea]